MELARERGTPAGEEGIRTELDTVYCQQQGYGSYVSIR